MEMTHAIALLEVVRKLVEQDYPKAYEWYLKSAEQEHSNAQRILRIVWEWKRRGPPTKTVGFELKKKRLTGAIVFFLGQEVFGKLDLIPECEHIPHHMHQPLWEIKIAPSEMKASIFKIETSQLGSQQPWNAQNFCEPNESFSSL